MIKGSMAGTALRGGLTRLIAPTDKAKALMEEYGIAVQKTSDGNVDLRATMEHLREKMGGLDVDTQNMLAKVIFGQTAMNGWLAVINADADAFSNLALQIDNSSGSAERMAETMTDNLWGDIQELSSAVEESLLQIFDAVEPMLRGVVQGITKIVLTLTNVFNGLSPTLQKVVIGFALLTATLAPILLIFGTFINVIGGMITNIGVLSTFLGGLSGSFLTLGGALTPFIGKLKTIGLTFLRFSGWIGVATVALGLFYSSMQEDAIESVDVITEGMSDAGKALAEPFIKAKTEIDTVMLEMSNTNVKVTEDMVSRMETSLGGMVDRTVKMMENSQSKVKTVLSKNMEELTGANEKQISDMKNRVDEIYSQKVKIIQEKEKAVLDIQKKAQEEGRGLFADEKSHIQTLLKDIQQISIDTMSTMNTEISDLERRMIDNKDALNAESISKAVKGAQEKREKIVDEANKEYQELLSIQKFLGDDLTAEEQSKLTEMVGLAKNRKDQLVGVADQEYSALIQSARRLARDNVKEIDWATGEVKTKWEVFTSSFGQGFTKLFFDMALEWEQWTNKASNFGTEIEILKLKWDKLWAKGAEKDAIQDKIDNLEKAKEQMTGIIDRMQDLDSDISSIASGIDSSLRQGIGISLAQFVNDTDGWLTKASENFESLPIDVQKSLLEYDKQLRQAGVSGGLKQLVQYVKGDVKNIRMEFQDLPKSAQSAVTLMEKYFNDSADALNGMTFEEFVLNAQTAGVDVTKAFEKLPPNIRTAMQQIPKEDWKQIMEYYKMSTVEGLDPIPEEFNKTGKESGKKYKEGVDSTKEQGKQAGKDLGKSSVDGAKESKEQHKQAGVENGNAQAEGTKSTKEQNRQAGTENAKASVEGFKGGLQDLPNALKEQLANAGVTIKQDGSLIVQDFEKTGRDGVTGFVNAMNSQLPQLDGVTVDISNRLASIDNIRLGNVTKQLSEVNRWLGVIQGTSVGTYGALRTLTTLPFGNTTRGLSQINQWLMRTSNRARDARSAMVQLTNLPFGNTTRGLSEVNQWLMRTTNRSKDTQKALKSITEVTFGRTTKGLSEVNRWLTTVRSSANNAKSALNTLSNVRFGGVTKGLSEVNRWLNTVKNTASGTKSALYAVARAKSSMSTSSYAVKKPKTAKTAPATTGATSMMTLGAYAPSVRQLPQPMTFKTATRDSWLDFGDITNYKTSGGFYNPSSLAPKNDARAMQQESKSNEVIKQLVQQNQLLIQLLTSERNINVGVQVDGRQIAKASAKYVEEELNTLKNRKARLMGSV